MNETSIEFIMIKPRNDKYCIYTINGNEEQHSKKLDDMIDFILLNVGSHHSSTINDLIWTFQPFIVIISTEEIIPLKADLNKEREEFFEDIQNVDVKQALRELREQDEKNDLLHNYSKQAKNLSVANKFWKKR